jgi:hypothetical protein
MENMARAFQPKRNLVDPTSFFEKDHPTRGI